MAPELRADTIFLERWKIILVMQKYQNAVVSTVIRNADRSSRTIESCHR